MIQRKLSRIVKKRGSTLVTVIVIFGMFVLLSVALMTASTQATLTMSNHVKDTQYYLTAKSAIDATMSALKDPHSSLAQKLNTMNDGDTLTAQNVGSSNPAQNFTITIVKTGTNFKVTANAEGYHAEPTPPVTLTVNQNTAISTSTVTSTTTSTTQVKTDLPDYYDPFNCVRYYTGDNASDDNTGIHGFGNTANGNYYTSGLTSIEGVHDNSGVGAVFNGGAIVSSGNLWLTGIVSAPLMVNVDGNLQMSRKYFGPGSGSSLATYKLADSTESDSGKGANTLVLCDVNVTGNLVMTDGSVIGSSDKAVTVKVNGDIAITKGSLNKASKIYGTVYCLGKVYIEKDCSISGTIHAKGGAFTCVSGKIATNNDSLYNNSSTNSNNKTMISVTADTSGATKTALPDTTTDFTKTANKAVFNYTPPSNMPTNIGTDPSNDHTITDLNGKTATITRSGSVGTIDGKASSGAFTSTQYSGSHNYSSITITTGTSSIKDTDGSTLPDSSKAVSLVVPAGQTLTLNCDLYINGDNNVYLYLCAGATIKINGHNVGTDSGKAVPSYPKLIIIGNGTNQVMNFDNSSNHPIVSALVYMPKGSWVGFTNMKFYGTHLIQTSVKFGSNTSMGNYTITERYKPTILTGSPLDKLSDGGYSVSTETHTIVTSSTITSSTITYSPDTWGRT